MHLYFRLLHRVSTPRSAEEIGFIRGTIKKVFGKYLFLTNTVTCGALMAAGDIIQQEIEIFRHIQPKETTKSSDKNRYDWKRIERMFLVGLAQGPPQHVFYKVLDRFLPKRDMYSIMKKILMDQFIASPMCIIIFFSGMGYLEGHDLDGIIKEFKSKFLTVYTVDWMVWPPIQFINFYYLTPKYRVVYINFLTMLYDVFLSYVKHDMES